MDARKRQQNERKFGKVMVMLHSGVCLLRHYTAFAGIVHGQKTHKFFNKLVPRRLATSYTCRHNRGRIYHVRNKALYRAIGEIDSRYRRPLSAARVVEGFAIGRRAHQPWTHMARDEQELMTPLSPRAFDELQWYFAQRRASGGDRNNYRPCWVALLAWMSSRFGRKRGLRAWRQRWMFPPTKPFRNRSYNCDEHECEPNRTHCAGTASKRRRWHHSRRRHWRDPGYDLLPRSTTAPQQRKFFSSTPRSPWPTSTW
jgi:hypothetical protein